MKTLSGPPQLCRVKVIKTMTKNHEMVFFSNMKWQEIILRIFCYDVL